MLLGSAITGSVLPVAAQSSPAASQAAISGPVPLTAAQIQAARSLTPTQIAQLKVKLQPMLAKLKAQIAVSEQQTVLPSLQDVLAGTVKPSTNSLKNPPKLAAFTFTNSSGRVITASPSAAFTASAQSSSSSTATTPELIGCPLGQCVPPPCAPGKCCGSVCPIPGPPYTYPGNDADQDGLPDTFEALLADNFTPVYSISAGEQQQFATFQNYVPMTVASLLGPNTPFSYYRVVPAGFIVDSANNLRYVIRIDYLTLWNADGGLPSGNLACDLSYVGLDQVIQELSGHDLDVERSGMYVSAPAVNGGYNPNSNAYSIGYIYTAAHEGTFFDNSSYGGFANDTQPAGTHMDFALSLSKHSTYPYNPDYVNLIPLVYMEDFYASLSILYAEGVIDFTEYALIQLEAADVFNGCIVERFHDQGGSIAQGRVNVGEPAHPINGSTFIQDDSSRALKFTDKLTNPLPYY